MSIKEFAKTIAFIIGGEVVENDGKTGVTLASTSPECNSKPIAWVDDVYKDYIDGTYPYITLIANDIYEALINIKPVNVSIKLQDVIDKISLRLYNPNNKTNDIFISAAKYGFSDLILIPFIEDIIENGSVMIKRDFLNIWNISEEQLFEIAFSNMTFNIFKAFDFIKQHTNIPDIAVDFGMYAVTNTEFNFGASSIILAKDELWKIFPDGFIVLPSSVHECMVVGINDYVDEDDKKELTKLVHEVNSQMCDSDILSDRIYVFNK